MKNVNRKIDYEMGKFIWSIVDKSEYSQEKWAEILNVSTRTMGYYCSGERKPTQRKLLQLIKVAGGINAEDIRGVSSVFLNHVVHGKILVCMR